MDWDDALTHTVDEIKRIQEKYGNNAFGMLSGVSLSNEKSYLVGKFARVALKTANLDYNGRLCMVSAGAGNKKAFGLDRISNSFEDLERAEVIIVTGANISETFPTLTHWIWRARDYGAKLIVIDPRMIPLARTADLHLPVKPGTDSALLGAMLKYLADNDMLDHDFIRDHTSGFDEALDIVKDYTLEWAEAVTGIEKEKIETAAKWWGQAKTSFLLHARGIEHHTKGVDNVVACINLVVTVRLRDKETGRGAGSMVINVISFRETAILKIRSTVNIFRRFGVLMKRICREKGILLLSLSKLFIVVK
jgi:assimilatory nitrate reductase catalytic subunit